jgi:hypothetical protein
VANETLLTNRTIFVGSSSLRSALVNQDRVWAMTEHYKGRNEVPENEPPNSQTILEKAVVEAIKDLQQAQARGIDRRHKEVLIWKACFDLQRTMEKLDETKNCGDGT